MMKNYLKSTILLLPFALLAGCSEEQTTGQNPNEPVAVSLTAGIGNMTITRMLDGKWETGDAIGLCMNPTGTAETINGVFNYCYKITSAGANGKLSPDGTANTAYFPADGSKVDFLAYHPYKANALTRDFTLPVDVSRQPATDLLTARTNGHDRTAPAIALSFGHRLVKLIFTLKGSGSLTNDLLAGAHLVIKGMDTQASCLLTDGSITGHTATQDITVPLNAQGTTGEAIVLPRAAAQGVSYVVTLADGNAYTAYMSAEQELKAGTKNTFNLTLQPVPSIVPVIVSATVEPWKDGTEADLTSSVAITVTASEASSGIGKGALMGVRAKGASATATSHYTYDGTNWNASDPALWWETLGETADLYAWMPASTDHQPNAGNLLAWSIDADQNKGYAAFDLLLSNNVKGLVAGQPAALQFGHALSAVTLTLLPGDGFTAADMKRATLKLNAFPTKVTANVATSALTGADTPKDITPVKADNIFRAILIPTSKDEGELIATITLDGAKFTCPTGEKGFSFDPGKHHALRLTLNKTGVSMSGSVSDWEEGSGGDFTIQ